MADWATPTATTGEPPIKNLRVRAARGTIINSAFQIGLAVLSLLRQLAVAAFLTQEQFGLWGILLAILNTLVWLKQIGIADKYIQQTDSDQELAFQKAFTLELAVSFGYFVFSCLVLPLFALAYGHTEIILPGFLLATSVILTAFQTPAWIQYRRLNYGRQRLLTSVDPVISMIGMVALAAAGFGYWGLVIGGVVGSFVGAIVCVATSPYRLRIRFDMQTLREYVSFSWPLLGLSISRLVVIQGSLLTATRSVGLAAVGALGLAASYATFSDKVNAIVSQTIYPAVCRIADRKEALQEVFLKSNRVALMWGITFGVGLALFSGDLVNFLLGDKWEDAINLLAAFGVICGLGQLAIGWTIFMRAVNRTKPLFVAALFDVAVFFVVMIPAVLTLGVTGYVIGFGTAVFVQVLARTYFMRTLIDDFNLLRHTWRAIAPVLIPTALILGIREVAGGGRSPARAVAELALYFAATAVFTYFFERRLITELLGYLRGRGRPAPAPGKEARALA